MKLVFMALLMFPILSFSQISAIQDNSGQTSILFGGNKSVIFSSADASIGSSLSFLKAPAGKAENFFGFTLKVKSNEGVSKLIDGYNFKPNFSIGFFNGKYLLTTSKSKSTYYYYHLGINNSYFNYLIQGDTNQLSSKNFFGWMAKVGINNIGVIGSTRTLFGSSVEYGRYNNLDDLTSFDRYTSTVDTTSTPNLIFLSKKKSGFMGNYLEKEMLKVNIDYLLYPQFANSRLAIGGFYRGGFGGSLGKQDLGFGIYLAQDQAPDKIVLGIVYQINDVFNQQKEESGFQKRTGVNLVAGYNF